MWADAKTPATCEEVARSLEIETATDSSAFVADAQIVVLCVKPKQVASVVERLAGLRPDALVVTILAGVTTERLQALLGRTTPWSGR